MIFRSRSSATWIFDDTLQLVEARKSMGDGASVMDDGTSIMSDAKTVMSDARMIDEYLVQATLGSGDGAFRSKIPLMARRSFTTHYFHGL